MKRREFIAKIPVVPLSAMAIGMLSACSGGSGGSDSPPVITNAASCTNNGATSDMRFDDGHVHPANAVSAADISTAVQKTYTSPMDTTGHRHNFTLAAAHFADLQRGVAVTIITDPDATGHTHPVVVSCNA